MSKTANPSKEYESANGGPEKGLGDTEVSRDEGDEGDESDDYEEIDDEVCVQKNITKIWEFNPFWQEERQIAGDGEDEEDGEEVCVCAQPIFMYSTTTQHHLQEQQSTLTHLLIGNVSYIYLFICFISMYWLDKAEWRG